MLPVSVRMSGGGEGIVAHELLKTFNLFAALNAN